MRRTRKWAYVQQEARRLAELGLSPLEIAERIHVNRSTVQRWMAAGQVVDTRRSVQGRAPIIPVTGEVTPAGWAEAVRAAYALDVTDAQLVTLAEEALRVAQHPHEDARVKLGAMGRFQAIVKQLALVARPAVEEVPAQAEPRLVQPRVPRVDPRGQLTLQ